MRRRILYGRQRGPRLRQGRQTLLDQLLPRLAIDLPDGTSLDPATLFTSPLRDIWLEIGFGGGEHLASLAAANPDIGFIGCEPYINGVARLLSAIDRQGLDNVRILVDDARMLLAALKTASVGRGFILFPDPWPKTRHHKRRIVNPQTIADLARVIRPDGDLRLATDDVGYASWMLRIVLGEPRFAWTARRPAHWRHRPEDWPPTRYEAKAITAGRAPVYLHFKRHKAAMNRREQIS